MLSILSPIIIVAGLIVYLIAVYRGTKSLATAFLATVVTGVLAGFVNSVVSMGLLSLARFLPAGVSFSIAYILVLALLRPAIFLALIYVSYRVQLFWPLSEVTASPKLISIAKHMRVLTFIIAGLAALAFVAAAAISILYAGNGAGLSLLFGMGYGIVMIPLVVLLLIYVGRFMVEQGKLKKGAVQVVPPESPVSTV